MEKEGDRDDLSGIFSFKQSMIPSQYLIVKLFFNFLIWNFKLIEKS